MQFDQNLAAGVEVRQQTSGSYFAFLSMGATTGLTVQFYAGNEVIEELRNVTRRFRARFAQRFDAVVLKSANAATVSFIISEGAVDIEGGDVNATITGPLPLPVSNDRGSPGNLLYVSGVSVADAPAVAASNNGPVACTAVAAVIAAADATRRELRITNLGPDPVAIGPAGITWANRVIVLYSGDTYVETRGANLAWSGICAAATTASVTWQGVTA